APGGIIERSISGQRVVRFLDELARTCGYPRGITVDNGPEFISNALDQWAHAHGVQLHLSRPGKPVDNAFIESFDGRLRDECFNTNWFYALEHAREVINEWLDDYGHVGHLRLTEEDGHVRSAPSGVAGARPSPALRAALSGPSPSAITFAAARQVPAVARRAGAAPRQRSPLDQSLSDLFVCTPRRSHATVINDGLEDDDG